MNIFNNNEVLNIHNFLILGRLFFKFNLPVKNLLVKFIRLFFFIYFTQSKYFFERSQYFIMALTSDSKKIYFSNFDFLT